METDKYLKEKQLTSNADKTELFSFSDQIVESKITYKGNLINFTETCRYLGKHIDPKLSFEVHLNIVLRQ